MAKKVSTSRERIKELMNFYNLSQTELCKRTGLQKSALSNYLSGEREPRQNQLSTIADPFNIDPTWLMGYDVPMYLTLNTNELSKAIEDLAKHSKAVADSTEDMSKLINEVTDIVNRYQALPADKRLDFQKYLKYLQSDV